MSYQSCSWELVSHQSKSKKRKKQFWLFLQLYSSKLVTRHSSFVPLEEENKSNNSLLRIWPGYQGVLESIPVLTEHKAEKDPGQVAGPSLGERKMYTS